MNMNIVVVLSESAGAANKRPLTQNTIQTCVKKGFSIFTLEPLLLALLWIHHFCVLAYKNYYCPFATTLQSCSSTQSLILKTLLLIGIQHTTPKATFYFLLCSVVKSLMCVVSPYHQQQYYIIHHTINANMQ